MATRYTTLARVLHWTVAIFVLVQIGLGFWSDWADRELARSLLDKHVQLGLAILALMVLRISWRLGHPPPPLPAEITVWQKRAARCAHAALYFLLIAMPVSGYLLWMWIGAEVEMLGLFQLPVPDLAGQDESYRSLAGYAHEYSGYMLIALVVVHICAAIWHELIEQHRLIRGRMI